MLSIIDRIFVFLLFAYFAFRMVSSPLIQITRLLREEALQNKDRTYRDYASQVRYRLVPMVF